MNSEFSKYKVIDSRIKQDEPSYAINVGALSISNIKTSANTASNTSLTFNINAPSANVFMDRVLPVSTGVNCATTFNFNTGPGRNIDGATTTYANITPDKTAEYITDENGVRPLLRFGVNCALNAYPLQSMLSTAGVTINGATNTITTGEVLHPLLHLTSSKRNRRTRTTPTRLDRYLSHSASHLYPNSNIQGYGGSSEYGNTPNGAFYNVVFTDHTGAPLKGTGAYQYAGKTYRYVDGIPVVGCNAVDNGAGAVKYLPHSDGIYELFFRYTITEKLMISPFIFDESQEDSVGLFGINNVNVSLQIGNTSRILALDNAETVGGLSAYSISGTRLNGSNPFIDPHINSIFRTPSLDTTLPERSIVPFVDIPYYISPQTGVLINPGEIKTIQSNSINLSEVPDLLLICVRKPNYNATESNWFLPPKKLSLNFDNHSGLLSSMTQEQLYDMAVRNGLDMDYNQFFGQGKSMGENNKKELSPINPTNIPLSGGFILVKPAQDLQLQSGLASGVNGKFNLQFSIDVENQSSQVVESPVVYTICINSGFFVSREGSSAVVRSPLSESDITQAKIAGETSTHRMFGGSFFSKLGSTLKNTLFNPTAIKLAKHVAKNSGNPYASTAADMASLAGLGSHTGGKQTGGSRNMKYLNL